MIGSTLILAGATALVWFLRRDSAATRHVVWTSAFVALLLLPFARLALPSFIFELPTHIDIGVPTPTRASPQDDRSHRRSTEPATNDAPVAGGVAAGDAPPAPVAALMGVVWAGGFVAVLAHALVGLAGVRRLRSSAAHDVPDAIQRATARCAARIGLRTPVRVLIGTANLSPMTWGLHNAIVLLPPACRDWNEARLDAVLLHELAHITRRDAVTIAIARLAVAAYWPNPLAWFARRQAQADCERAADDRVLTSGVRPSDYCTHLLGILETTVMPNSALSTLPMTRRTRFHRRLSAILDPATSHARAARVGIWASTAVGAIMIAAAVTRPVETAAFATATASGLHVEGLLALDVHSVTVPSPVPQRSVRGMAPLTTAPISAPVANQPRVDLSGEWLPVDPVRQAQFFDVGITDITPLGMTIVQRDSTMTIVRAIPEVLASIFRGRRDLLGPQVYQLDGSKSTNGPADYSVVSYASVEGDKIIIRANPDRLSLTRTYSLDGALLKIESMSSRDNGPINSTTFLFKRRA